MKPEKLIDNFYKQLNKFKVRYLVIGGMAVNYYGVIRTTKDIDIFVEANHDNIANLLSAMEKAGFETALEVTPEKMMNVDVTVFQDVIRVDIMTSVSGINFATAWNRKKIIAIGRNKINLIDIDDLITSKKIAGRNKDLDDVEKLLIVKKMLKGE